MRPRLRTGIAVLLGTALVTATAVLGTPAEAATAFVSFYEGNGGAQTNVCNIAVPASGAMAVRQVDFTNNPYSCDNDEARSLAFINSAPGLIVEVWDRSSCANPAGQSRSDYSRSELAVPASRIVVPTFEATTGQIRGLPYYETYYRSNGNLDGKVSCVRISRSR
jgi:hypothetical protein